MSWEKEKIKGIEQVQTEHDACGIGAVVKIDGEASHKIVDQALTIVERMEHRAGKDALQTTGDGVGVMIQIPHELFVREMRKQEVELGEKGSYGVGMCFFPMDETECEREKNLLSSFIKNEDMELLGFREVPVCPGLLSFKARECMPHIMQCIIRKPADCADGLEFDRRLYIVRRQFEKYQTSGYICSLSCRTIVYKGMFLTGQLRRFYPDLEDQECRSALALVHARFSTNTTPSWKRAHPNRYILHNGEINTIQGNVDRMSAREENMRSSILKKDLNKVLPVADRSGSDSAMLDNTLEFLLMNGVDLPEAVMKTIPEPFAHDSSMPEEKKDFYRYNACMMEPWDGPAAIVFSDGDLVGAVLDRNGLRPCRWYQTKDGRLVLSSEAGVLEEEPSAVLKKSRLMPGKMLVVDLKEKRVLSDEEIKMRAARRHPYGEWLKRNLLSVDQLSKSGSLQPMHTQAERDRLYKVFGYTFEDVRDSIQPMASTGVEVNCAMGADVPLAAMSSVHQPLFNYFQQHFAQVTNPPIDAIREEIVTDTTVYAGASGNLLEEQEGNCRLLQLPSCILTSKQLQSIKEMEEPGFSVRTVSLLYPLDSSLKEAMDRLFKEVDRALQRGATILILCDRGVDVQTAAIPSLLAVSGVHHHLLRTMKRTAVSLIVESAEPREVHHFAALLGYGATAVNPWLAQECAMEMVDLGMIDKTKEEAVANYDNAVLHGIVKIASKMGISTLQSYEFAKIFEAVGLSHELIDRYFTGTVSRVEGIGLSELEEDIRWHHDRAYDPLGLGYETTLDSVGTHKLRAGKDKEEHMYNARTILLLQQAVHENDYEKYKKYVASIEQKKHPFTLRDLLEFKPSASGSIPIEEVECEESILHRFKASAMSYGALSEEAHECIAVAMNRLGAMSNCGEGGEDPSRFNTERNSAIKQVASARFGVTSSYLLSAKEIQIKMAQGAKPGEGGQLPGAKVYPWIARARFSTPGVTLISPPPHHDIYSIEDLAQLIYDLKNANPDAELSVKLCSEAGVGTVASGVAKAGAQVVVISGYDGGTGSAPQNSIYHAGLPWELGVAETHRALLASGLRNQVAIETDSKLMSGKDVAIACMLGAEQFGFGTALLVCMGCCMMRACNLNTCPAGIATQNPDLRRRFAGKPEDVMNFLRFTARSLREIMAYVGVHSVEELVGRSDLLVQKKEGLERADRLMLNCLLDAPCNAHYEQEKKHDFKLENTLDHKVLLKQFLPEFEGRRKGEVSLNVHNTDRSFGTLFGSKVTSTFGNELPSDSFVIHAQGAGGQSFGAFLPKGVTIDLEGESNDGFGKGLCGGTLTLFAPMGSPFVAEENIIVGNVALYGATSGAAYIAGVAGERFCVRNSGATAVVEGVGNHGCEYMTGGVVVDLGEVGMNFAAGMSGGKAFVLDRDGTLKDKVNNAGVQIRPVEEETDIVLLKECIQEHVRRTGSVRGAWILDRFEEVLKEFRVLVPMEYERISKLICKQEALGMSKEAANMAAFEERA